MRFIIPILTLGLVASIPSTAAATGSDEALERVAKRSAASLQIKHDKARKALVNMSRDRLFESYFKSDEMARRNLHSAVLGSRSLVLAKRIEANTLSLLDGDGQYIVKVAEEEILDIDEAGRALSHGVLKASAHDNAGESASPIYLSQQLGRWVVAHSRRISTSNGFDALLHAEFDLKSLQRSISRKSRPKRIELLAVTEDGWVVFDSRKSIPTDRRGSSQHPADYFEQFEIAGMDLQALLEARDNDSPIYADDGTQREIAVSRADNWYLVAIGTRIRLGTAPE